jgi:hypothetical protein
MDSSRPLSTLSSRYNSFNFGAALFLTWKAIFNHLSVEKRGWCFVTLEDYYRPGWSTKS